MTSARNIIIGTRKSNLAIAQSHEIKNLIQESSQEYRENFNLISIQGFKTTGDSILDKSLSDIGGKGLFTKEIEDALISKEISLAVHSMKDMPAIHPEGLDIMAIAKREDPRDAFISLKYKSIQDLPQNAVIGTSSTRRKALLLKIRPDLKIVNFRGNVNTRLKKIENGEVDATILAVAGLKRIKMEHYIASIISRDIMLPAIGQGAIGVQARLSDKYSCDLIKNIDHFETSICIKAERAFLKEVDGSCQTPIAAHCQIENNSLHLKALICTTDGKDIYETSRIGSFEEAQKIGRDAGLEMKEKAQHILDLF
jgi:hydroxymethylbilane synthase